MTHEEQQSESDGQIHVGRGKSRNVKAELRETVSRLAARHQGLIAAELAAESGQEHRTAHAYLYRLVKQGELIKRIGPLGGKAVTRYWSDPANARAWEFEPRTKIVKGTKGMVTARVRMAIVAGAHDHKTIGDAIGSDSPQSVVSICKRLTERGEIFRADNLDGKNHACYRYFSTAEARDAWSATANIEARRAELRETEAQRKRDRSRQDYLRKTASRSTVKTPRPSGNARARRDNAVAEMLQKRRIVEGRQLEVRAQGAKADGPPIITADTVITRAGSKPDHRFSVDGPVIGVFSQMRPGQYAFEAKSCAAKAAEAMPA